MANLSFRILSIGGRKSSGIIAVMVMGGLEKTVKQEMSMLKPFTRSTFFQYK